MLSETSSYRSYWRQVIRRSWAMAWAFAVPHSLREGARLAIVTFALLFLVFLGLRAGWLNATFLQEKVLEIGAILVITTLLVVVIFLGCSVLVAPYLLWKEAVDAGFRIPAGHVLMSIDETTDFGVFRTERQKYRAQAEAIAKKHKLEQWLSEIDRDAEIHGRAVDQFTRAMSAFSDSNKNPMEQGSFMDQYSITLKRLMDTRAKLQFNMNELLGEAHDLEATPLTDDNPFSVEPPGVDGVALEKWRHEYRKQWEKIEKVNKLFSGLKLKISQHIGGEERKILEFGGLSTYQYD